VNGLNHPNCDFDFSPKWRFRQVRFASFDQGIESHWREHRSTTTGSGKIVGFGKRYSILRLFVVRVFSTRAF